MKISRLPSNFKGYICPLFTLIKEKTKISTFSEDFFFTVPTASYDLLIPLHKRLIFTLKNKFKKKAIFGNNYKPQLKAFSRNTI